MSRRPVRSRRGPTAVSQPRTNEIELIYYVAYRTARALTQLSLSLTLSLSLRGGPTFVPRSSENEALPPRCRVRAGRTRFRLHERSRATRSAAVATRSAIHCRRTAIPFLSRVYPARTRTPCERARRTATNRDPDARSCQPTCLLQLLRDRAPSREMHRCACNSQHLTFLRVRRNRRSYWTSDHVRGVVA